MSIPYILIKQNTPPKSGDMKEITYARSVISTKLNSVELAKRISKISTVSLADVMAVLYGLREVIPAELAKGNAVNLEGVGSFRVSATTGKLEPNEQIVPNSFKTRRIVYTPSKEFKETLENLSYEQRKT